MFNDELTDRVVAYTRIMRWALPLTILVTFLVFVAAYNTSLPLVDYAFTVLFWGCLAVSGFFVLSIPFVFIEHWRCGFICLGTVVVSYLLVSGVMNYPMMRIHDGCPCGMSRSWYEWRGRKLKFTIENEGNPGHQHRFWDAQQGLRPYLPW